MTFSEYISVLDYSPTYAANCVLYQSESRPAKLANNLGYKPDAEELTKLRYLVSGKQNFEQLFGAVVEAGAA